MKKIYITGCAKTGTTLVRRLFNAFNLKVYNKGEISLHHFIEVDYNVGKRTVSEIFSNVISYKSIQKSLKTIKENDISIINVVRRKEDVLKSSNHYVKEVRYDASMEQAETYKDYITYTVIYEDLIENPNKIQDEIANKLNLEILHKWSDYPSFINVNEEKFKNNNYTLRPIGEKYKKK
jgi:Fe2+ transport system protein B